MAKGQIYNETTNAHVFPRDKTTDPASNEVYSGLALVGRAREMAKLIAW